MKNSGLLLACLLAFTLLFASPAYPTEIIREMPANAVVDEVVTVVLLLDMVTVGEKLVYTETIPSGFSFGSWEIDGSEESASQIIVNVQGDQYTWEFTPSEEFVILNYIAFAPQEPGNFIFRGYMEDNGIGYNDQAAMQITAEAVDPCGDGVCDIDEDESICPVDCSSLGSIEGELEITLTPDMIESIEYGDGTTPEVQEMGQSIEGVGEETPSQGQAQASNLLDTSTTPPPASTASAEDIFARKKTGPDPKVIVLLGASLAVLGLTVYGIYAQINKKKSGASANPLQQARDTAEEVKETLERMRSRTLPKNAPPAPSRQRISSELPSFTDGTSSFELPAIPKELRKDQARILSIPPIPAPNSARPGLARPGTPPLPRREASAQPQSADSRQNLAQPKDMEQPVSNEDVDKLLDSVLKNQK